MSYRVFNHPVRKVVLPILFSGVAVYFIYHAFYGKRGVFSWRQVNNKLTLLHGRLDALKQENSSLENKVSRLRSNSLDPDLLDEQIRKILGWNDKDEVVIVDPGYKF
ncbi:MAG: septum formation initiator family protein [Holosporales bacterium]|jgi:cell division protein FtsB|nr:septum formation initiator family protein [Holosporales bacterium]